MAVVIDLSGNGGGKGAIAVDKENFKPNRTINQANGPWGNTTPAFSGEMIVNTNDKWVYRAYGTGINDWEQIQRSSSGE